MYEYIYCLSLVPSFGAKKLSEIVGMNILPEELFSMSPQQHRSIGLTSIQSRSISNLDRSKELDLLKGQLQKDEEIIVFGSTDYPERLYAIPSPPLVLYKKGNASLNSKRAISVVGMRDCSKKAIDIVDEFCSGVSNFEPTIISGLANGIDQIAHSKAVKYKMPTLAVLGTGLDVNYPKSGAKLRDQILESGGALISEFKPGTPALKNHFPRRNRIVAGLADGVVIVQSKSRGGSLITAKMAFDYDREVMAYPGNYDDCRYNGCHQLIKEQKAHLITSYKDVLKILNWDVCRDPSIEKEPSRSKIEILNLSDQERSVVEVVELHGKITSDELIREMVLSSGALSILLLKLELGGILKKINGGQYVLSNR